MITYDLWWGNNCLCRNYTDPVEVVNEVCDRANKNKRYNLSDAKFFYSDSWELLQRVTAKSSGVLLVGTTPRRMYDINIVVPPRAYQIVWREVEDTP